MFKNLYNKVEALALKPAARIWLGIISFIESSFFPIPADVVFIPMVLADKNSAYRLAFIATATSVLGGIFGYFIGMYAFDLIALPMLKTLNKVEVFYRYRDMVNHDLTLLWGLLFSSGLSHIPPIKVVTILSGVAQIPLWKFIVSAIIGRGIRFYFLAWLIHRYGDSISHFIQTKLKIIMIVFSVALFIAYIIYKMI